MTDFKISLLPTEIKKHLMLHMSAYTDLFSQVVTVSAASVVSADTLGIQTATPVNLQVNDIVMITGGFLENTISQVAFDGIYALFTTFDPHDFTKPKQSEDPDKVEFIGFSDPTWNSSLLLIDVPNKNTIKILKPEGAILPILTGLEKVLEDRPFGLRGAWPVDSVSDPSNFTVKIAGRAAFPINPVQDLKITIKTRISSAIDFQRAVNIYTKVSGPREAWLYLIMGDVDVSKDRKTLSDAVAEQYSQDEGRLMLLQNFSTAVFLPTDSTTSGLSAENIAYGEAFGALLKTLYGLTYNNGKSELKVVFAGHGKTLYNTAFYAQVYDWQIPVTIDRSYGYEEKEDVALREINIDFALLDEDNPDLLKLKIRLDGGS